ncbi:MAG: hypothetical protein ACRDJX_00540 [Solirubrobacteraceae bacterium]
MIVASADLIAERESSRLSVAAVVTRAGVAPGEFYAAFNDLEDCLLAAFDEGMRRLTRALAEAVPAGASLLRKIEAGLLGLLRFLEEEPGWGRLLLIELSVPARGRRERAIGQLVGLLSDSGFRAAFDLDPPPSEANAARLSSEVLAIITANMRDGEEARLAELAPWLMGSVIEPELAWQDGEQVANAFWRRQRAPGRTGAEARAGRARWLLRAIRQCPGASNRKVAEAAGVPNDSKISAQLRRLQREGLIRNVTVLYGRGQANAWVLTEAGYTTVEVKTKTAMAAA